MGLDTVDKGKDVWYSFQKVWHLKENGPLPLKRESEVPIKTKIRVKESLEIIRDAVEQFGTQNLGISFNGGKDCLVMLYLIFATYEQLSLPRIGFPTVYIRTNYTFKEVDKFVDICAQKYQLDIVSVTQPMKQALETYLSDHKNITAVFVGIRRADPYTEGLKFIQKTDKGWPEFVRLHPVLEWEYDDIWTFLRVLNITYCELYDQGYTSLGSTTSTVKNPSLQREDGTYRPAYELDDNELERVGRMKSPKC